MMLTSQESRPTILQICNKVMKYVYSFILLLIFTSVASSNNYYQDALLNFQNNNFEKTIEYLEKNIVFNPKSSESYVLLGKAYSELSDINKSYKYYNIAFTLSPENKELNFLLGEKSYELGLIEEYGEYISNLEIICSGSCNEIDNLKQLTSE